MKYICINPERMVEQYNKIGMYGRGSIINRINLNKSEPEHGLFRRVFIPCQNVTIKKEPEANVTEAFEYTYIARRCNVEREDVWYNLKKLFDIVEIDTDEKGEWVIKLIYKNDEDLESKTEESELEQDEFWESLEAIYQTQGFNEYTENEIENIVKVIIDKYIEDMSKRKDIIFEQTPLYGKTLSLGGGTYYNIKDIKYTLEGESFIVKASFCAADIDVEGPESSYPTCEGYLNIRIYRKAKNGETELLAVMSKDNYKETEPNSEIKCQIGDKKYKVGTYLLKTVVAIGDGALINSPHDPDTKDYISQLVDPKKIDLIKQMIWSRLLFKQISSSVEDYDRDQEVTDWDESQKEQEISLKEANKKKRTRRKKEDSKK